MLTKHFSRAEMRCNCGQCDYDTADIELLEVLEVIRAHFNKPIVITSGNRCPQYNAIVGGKIGSQHPRGKAADIIVRDINPVVIYNFLTHTYPDTYGFGLAKSFVHVDVREEKGRWTY